MTLVTALPEPIEQAQLDAWRARLACGFPAVQDVLADCMVEAQAALSPAGIDAFLDCANALGRMGRGAEPTLAFLQEWPSVARIDNVHGDRNLVCACPPPEAFAE